MFYFSIGELSNVNPGLIIPKRLFNWQGIKKVSDDYWRITLMNKPWFIPGLTLTDCWFGTWMFFSIIYGVIIPAGFHIFQRGRLNQQPVNGPCFAVIAPTRYPTGHPPKVVFVPHWGDDCTACGSSAWLGNRLYMDFQWENYLLWLFMVNWSLLGVFHCHTYIYIYILSIYLSIYLYIYLSIYITVCVCLYVSIYVCFLHGNNCVALINVCFNTCRHAWIWCLHMPFPWDAINHSEHSIQQRGCLTNGHFVHLMAAKFN